ncbi:MAG TPA: hypothetical protein VEI97_12320, partial [bacterium]|nr:hypothetical protein [bacterium]
HRHRLPAVVKPHWYGPADDKLRRLGFWALWITLALYSLVFLYSLGDRALVVVQANATAAYLRPVVDGFAIEVRPTESREGLIQLTLENAADFPLPVERGRLLGFLTLETPAAPLLAGQAAVQFNVAMAPEQLPLKPFPRQFEPRTRYTFQIPFERWGQTLQEAPPGAQFRAEYTPGGAVHVYQPITLFEGRVDAVPAGAETTHPASPGP